MKQQGRLATAAMVGTFSCLKARDTKVTSRSRRRYQSRAGALLTLLMCCSVALSICARLNAQEIGGVTGTVTDLTGAVIPGAQVTFRNIATGIATHVATSSTGTYTATIPPGNYSLTVEAPGFKKFVETPVVAEVGATPTVNAKMNIGSSSETVQVTSTAIALNTTQPQLDTMLTPQEVTDLPLEINGNIRQISSFATLAPGVRPGSYGSVTIEGGAPGQINSAGTYYNGLQLDTASAVNSNPPYEMVDEFRVLRSTFSARYGLTQGAVSYNMRSGTNKFHGDGFLIDRNSVFDSAGFFPSRFDSTGKAIAPVDQETDWGGTVGGPILFPRLYNGRNRTFFLASLDIFNKNQGITNYGTVPTAAMKQGDFSKFVDSKGKQIPIYDPQTGKQFTCNNQLNVICSSRFDPLSKSLLQYVPDPNSTGNNYGQQTNMAPVIQSVPYKTQAWGLTLNHAITPSQNIAFTWWRNHYSVVQEENGATAIVPVSNPLTGEQSGIDNANIWLVNYEKTISSNLVFTAGLSAQNKMQNYVSDNKKVNFPGVTGSNTMPYLSFNGQNAITPWGNNNNSLIQNYVDNIGWNVFNNWMWTKGRHSINFGGEFHHYYEHALTDYSSGHFSFSQAETSVPNPSDPNFAIDGSSFASFLLGLVDSASRNAKAEVAASTQEYAAYLQDDIKLTTKLTMSAGVRWDIMVPYTMSMNNNVFLNLTAPNPAASNLPGAATQYGHCADCAGYDRVGIHWKNVGPHVGFAYSFSPKMVLQAGYYINYLGYDSAYGQGEGLGQPTSLAALLAGTFQVNGTGSYTPGYGPWSDSQGAPNPLPNVSPKPFSASLGVAGTINYLDPNTAGQAPMYQAWNASVQRQLGWNTLLTVAYSGNRVTHLTGYNINPISQPNVSVLQYGSVLTANINSTAAKQAGFTSPYPAFASQFGGGATVYQSLKNFPQYSNVARAFDQAGTTFYNAIQIQADKHTSNGLTFLASLNLPSQFDNLGTPMDKNNPAPEYVETADSWETKFATTYRLPFGQGQRWLGSGWVGRWIGGWEVAGILTYNNAGPLQITQSGESLLNGVNRPNIDPPAPLWSGNWDKVKPYFEGKGPLTSVFSTSAFTKTANQFVLGNSRRAYQSLRGPLYPTENLSVKKIFHVTEGTSFSVRMDYFNAFNRTQLPYPGTNINASNFGLINSKFSATNRQGQISARFNF